MYQLYDKGNVYKLPNGEDGTLERLMKDFVSCDTIPYVVKVQDNIIVEMTRLSVMKGIYNVSVEDDEAAVNEINEKIANGVEEQKSVQELQEKTNAVEASNAELMQAVAELGVIVASMQMSN